MVRTRNAEKLLSEDEGSSSAELVNSEDEDFVVVFENLTLSELNRRKRITWSDGTKLVVLKHAIRFRYSAKNMPPPKVLLELASLTGVPTKTGKTIFKLCLEKLVSLIGRLVCESTLRPALREVLVNGASTQKPVYKCVWAEFLVKDVLRDDSVDIRSIINPSWLEDRFQASNQALLPSVMSSGTSPSLLIKKVVSEMVRGKSIAYPDNWIDLLPEKEPTAKRIEDHSEDKSPTTSDDNRNRTAFRKWVMLRLHVIKEYRKTKEGVPGTLRSRLMMGTDLTAAVLEAYNKSTDYAELLARNSDLVWMFLESDAK